MNSGSFFMEDGTGVHIALGDFVRLKGDVSTGGDILAMVVGIKQGKDFLIKNTAIAVVQYWTYAELAAIYGDRFRGRNVRESFRCGRATEDVSYMHDREVFTPTNEEPRATYVTGDHVVGVQLVLPWRKYARLLPVVRVSTASPPLLFVVSLFGISIGLPLSRTE